MMHMMRKRVRKPLTKVVEHHNSLENFPTAPWMQRYNQLNIRYLFPQTCFFLF
jgi:hypothetical protein